MNEWTFDKWVLERHSASWKKTDATTRAVDKEMRSRAAIRWLPWIERCKEAEMLLIELAANKRVQASLCAKVGAHFDKYAEPDKD